MWADLEFKLCNLENAAMIGEIILSVLWTTLNASLRQLVFCDRCDPHLQHHRPLWRLTIGAPK